MPVTRCHNGHFYDSSAAPSCPWCSVSTDNGATQKVNNNTINMNAGSEGATMRIAPTSQDPQKQLEAIRNASNIAGEGHPSPYRRKKRALTPLSAG